MAGDREIARLFVQLDAEVNGLKRGLKEGDRAWDQHVKHIDKKLKELAELEERARNKQLTREQRAIKTRRENLFQMHRDAVDALRKVEDAEKDHQDRLKALWAKEERHFDYLQRQKIAAANKAERQREDAARRAYDAEQGMISKASALFDAYYRKVAQQSRDAERERERAAQRAFDKETGMVRQAGSMIEAMYRKREQVARAMEAERAAAARRAYDLEVAMVSEAGRMIEAYYRQVERDARESAREREQAARWASDIEQDMVRQASVLLKRMYRGQAAAAEEASRERAEAARRAHAVESAMVTESGRLLKQMYSRRALEERAHQQEMRGVWDLAARNYDYYQKQRIAADRTAAQEFKKSIQTQGRQLDHLKGKLKGVEVAAMSYARRGATLAAFTTGFAGLKALRAAGQYEQMQIAFEHMLGSAEKSNKMLEDLKNFAATTPFEFTELTEQAKRLMAVGFAADEVLPTLRKIGDATSALGIDNGRLNRITLALSQMRNAASISAQDMRQLTEAGIQAWKMLENGLKKRGVKGATPQNVRDPYWRKDKKLTGEMGFEIILGEMGGRYKGMMAKQSKTMLGMWSNFKDRLTYVLIEIGNTIIDRFNLRDKLSKAIEAMIDEKAFAAKVNQVIEPLYRFIETAIELTKWAYEHREAIKNVALGYAAYHVALRTAIGLQTALNVAESVSGLRRGRGGAGKAVAGQAAASAAAQGVTSLAGTRGAAAGTARLAATGASLALRLNAIGIGATAAYFGVRALNKHVDEANAKDKLWHDRTITLAEAIVARKNAAERLTAAQANLRKEQQKLAEIERKSGKDSEAYAKQLDKVKDAAAGAKRQQQGLNAAVANAKSANAGVGDGGKKNPKAPTRSERVTLTAELGDAKANFENAFRNQQDGLSTFINRLDRNRDSIKRLNDENSDLYDDYESGKMTLQEYSEQVNKNNDAIADHKEAISDARSAYKVWVDQLKTAREELLAVQDALGIKPADSKPKVPRETFKPFQTSAVPQGPGLNTRDMVKSVDQVNRALAKIGVGGTFSTVKENVDKLLDLTPAQRRAEFGTANINKILARAGLAPMNPRWKNEFNTSTANAVRDVRLRRDAVNRFLSQYGLALPQTANWGNALVTGIKNAISGAKAFAKNNPVSIGINAILNMTGLSGDTGGGLSKGLKPQMMNPLNIGQRMGLSMSSGYRPGAVTKDGKKSDHSTGNAIDMVGSKSEMAAYYKVMGSVPGLKQRIYSPLDGWSNDHYDHVHIAMRRKGGGIPGSSHQDTVPALLTKGEYIFTREAVNNAGGFGAMDNIHNELKKYRKGGAVGKKAPKKPKVGNVSGSKKPVKSASGASYIGAAAAAKSDTVGALVKQRNAQNVILTGLQDDENKATARVNREQKEFAAVQKHNKPGTKPYKAASKQCKDAIKDLKKIKDRRKDAAVEIVNLNKDIIDERKRIKDELAETIATETAAANEQETGKRNFMYGKGMEANDLLLSEIAVKEGDARRTAGIDDDASVLAQKKKAWQDRESTVRAYLSKTDLTGEERQDANNELASIMDTLASFDQGTNDAIKADQDAINAQEKKRADDAEANYKLSQSQYGILDGAGDLGYAGGQNAYQSAAGVQPTVVYNINALSGNDPAIQRAMASASNGGNSQGGNADILYSGRS